MHYFFKAKLIRKKDQMLEIWMGLLLNHENVIRLRMEKMVDGHMKYGPVCYFF
ncbi:hypothetical protein X975_17761, partial [Stegodyphus mimosarum]